MSDQLSKQTSIFGLHLWVVLGVCVGAAIVLLLFLVSLWLVSKRSKNRSFPKPTIPIVSKEIQEVRTDHIRLQNHHHFDPKSNNRTQIQSDPFPESDPTPGIERQALLPPPEAESPMGYNTIHIDIGKDHRISYPERFVRSSSNESGEHHSIDHQVAMVVPEVSHLGWGRWYTLRELEAATNDFAAELVIGEGGYGIVYHGILEDNTQIAVKNLLNNR